MCSRYTITSPIDAFRRLLAFDNALPNLEPDYNVAPTSAIPFVRAPTPSDTLDQGKGLHRAASEPGAGQGRVLDFGRWGLIPSWSKQPPDKPLINARSETVAEKPSFRAAFKRRRCLVPTDGFYEWQAQPAGVKGPKQPWYFRQAGGGPFAFAGLWEPWLAPDGSDIVTVTVLTGEAPESMRAIHGRAPIIVQPADYAQWLDHADEATAPVMGLLQPPEDDFFEFWPVDRRMSRVGAHNDAGLIEPLQKERGLFD
ncbi:MAG: SOS response-associated peptidase [Pseudomonadota bacterium]